MDYNLIAGLIYNMAVLLTLALIYTAFQNKSESSSILFNILFGLTIGLAGVLIMASGFQSESGFFFDTKSVLVSVSGLFFGLIPTAAAGSVMILYRIYAGGEGLAAGIAVIITSGMIGILWHRYRLNKILAGRRLLEPEFYLFGLAVHLNALIWVFILAKDVLIHSSISTFGVAVILYPAGSVLLSGLLKSRHLDNSLVVRLKDTSERLNNIIQGTNSGTWEWNVETGEQRINERWAEIIGYTLDEISPVSIETWKKYCHPQDYKGSTTILEEVFQKKKEYYELEFRMKHKSGDWVWISSTGSVNTWTKEGKPAVVSGTHTDITKNKHLEEELMLKQMQLSDVIEFLPDATLAIDSDKRVIIWNKAIEQMTGIPSGEMMGKGDYAYTVPFYGTPRGQLMDMILENDKNDKDITEKYRDIRIIGETIEAEAYCPALYDNKGAWIFMKVSPLHDHNGNVIGAIESIRDISEKKEAENELSKSEERFRIIFEEAPLGIGLFDLKTGKARQINKKITEIFGRSKEEMYELPWETVSHPDDMEEYRRNRQLLFEGSIKGFNMKKRYFKKDGSVIWINLTVELLDSLEEENPRELCMLEDISDKVNREEEILYLNCHDVLTGLYNRLFFEEEKRRLDTERQLPLSVIIGDVDGLKLINDGFGYASGDRLLVEAGNILSRCCRSEDIVSRIGGDEFCILLPQTTSEGAREISKRIRDLCEETSLTMGSGGIKVSISVGYDTKIRGDQSLSGIIVNAENSMRRRKLLERKSVRSDLMSSIKATMLEKSHETAEHAERMVMLSRAIGKKLNLSEDKIFDLELATTLHDIGKMSIDQQILVKTGNLTSEEWGEIKKHPEAGYRIAQATSELMPIAEYILSHHERWDGKGYPQGLKGEEIPLLARIINIVDSYDAMTSVRSYGNPLTKEEAILELQKCSGAQFDPKLILVFLEEVLTEM